MNSTSSAPGHLGGLSTAVGRLDTVRTMANYPAGGMAFSGNNYWMAMRILHAGKALREGRSEDPDPNLRRVGQRPHHLASHPVKNWGEGWALTRGTLEPYVNSVINAGWDAMNGTDPQSHDPDHHPAIIIYASWDEKRHCFRMNRETAERISGPPGGEGLDAQGSHAHIERLLSAHPRENYLGFGHGEGFLDPSLAVQVVSLGNRDLHRVKRHVTKRHMDLHGHVEPHRFCLELAHEIRRALVEKTLREIARLVARGPVG